MIESINVFKRTTDWFFKKTEKNQVTIILLIIIGGMGYYLNEKVNLLEDEIKEQSIVIEELRIENTSLKYQGLLLLDAYKDDPNPRWITDAKTHQVVSVNDAYEDKYLRPKGYNKMDLLYTDGSHIFGEEVVAKFIENNNLVIRLKRPITFNNELNETMKFPIGKNDYIYAIGGYEYLNFN